MKQNAVGKWTDNVQSQWLARIEVQGMPFKFQNKSMEMAGVKRIEERFVVKFSQAVYPVLLLASFTDNLNTVLLEIVWHSYLQLKIMTCKRVIYTSFSNNNSKSGL